MARMNATRINEQTRETEIEAIRQVVATIEHSQNNELPEEFLGLFRPDAMAVARCPKVTAGLWRRSGGGPARCGPDAGGSSRRCR
jgi:hypothetical protein